MDEFINNSTEKKEQLSLQKQSKKVDIIKNIFLGALSLVSAIVVWLTLML